MKRGSHHFEVLYTRYAPAIYRYLHWQSRDAILAQDLTSSTFEHAWRARASFKGGSEQAWLYRIARNLLTDHWRRKKDLLMDDIPALSEQLESTAPTYDYDEEQRLGQLGRAMDQLSEDLRTIVVLRFIEGLSAKEVGAILGLSEGNIRIKQFRALGQMRKWMDYEKN